MAAPSHRSENSLSGRIRRYAQVSTTVAGQAAKLAGASLLGGLDRGTHAAELKAALGGLKGPLMKVAQMMATIPDALPAEYAAELAQLQANAPPMGRPFVRRRMAAELGPDWERHFADFPLEAAAAASLGQVHRARLRDGREVACKLQYPEIEAAVEADLAQLRLVLSIWRRIDSAIDTTRIYEEISARLREELDYSLEARHMRLYGLMLASEPRVHVPEPILELSTRRLLTMSWLEGRPLLEFRRADQASRDRLALALFRAWYVPFYRFGVIHGDPHLGNYTVRPDLSINLLDFGCIRIFPARFVKGVIDLYWALLRDDRDLAVQAYESWGFAGLTNELVDILNEWARFLYEPLMEDRVRRISETNAGEAGRRVVERVHRRLREAGGVTVPREFVFMDRAAIGLGSVFLHLGAELNWHRLFGALIEDFAPEEVAARQARALAEVGLSSRDATG
ncbi:MAG: AarF/ABC1/UbiB kinase family protein [Geminicoccaceae bacterium]|nr:AarF/ABC1/UbiB kinase family protein [Geminicoccaceae bacterium]MDW8123248.1 AarF/ABC1/UbiB kinase family protein [Geminicoccaceae bacterium]